VSHVKVDTLDELDAVLEDDDIVDIDELVVNGEEVAEVDVVMLLEVDVVMLLVRPKLNATSPATTIITIIMTEVTITIMRLIAVLNFASLIMETVRCISVKNINLYSPQQSTTTFSYEDNFVASQHYF